MTTDLSVPQMINLAADFKGMEEGGVSTAMAVPAFLAMIQSRFTSYRSLANGVYMSSSFVLRSLVVVVVGALADQFGMSPGYAGSALLALLALPVIWRLRRDEPMGWRAGCLWGLASGVGFGVMEGIKYSADFYNGIWGGGVYLMRFASCVALHAVWTGSVAIFAFQQRKMIREFGNPLGYVNATFNPTSAVRGLNRPW